MAIMLGPSREERIKKEYNRLKRLLKELTKEKLQSVDGLLKRVAFMVITLEDLEDDINLNGTVEVFSQGDNYYDRQRPAATIYNTTIKNYTAACKQLTDLIPEGAKKQDGDDPFQKIMRRGQSGS